MQTEAVVCGHNSLFWQGQKEVSPSLTSTVVKVTGILWEYLHIRLNMGAIW
jgi:hypothetical protein